MKFDDLLIGEKLIAITSHSVYTSESGSVTVDAGTVVQICDIDFVGENIVLRYTDANGHYCHGLWSNYDFDSCYGPIKKLNEKEVKPINAVRAGAVWS